MARIKAEERFDRLIWKRWTRPRAMAMIKVMEETMAPEYHVALTGSMLVEKEVASDLDIIIFPHTTAHWDADEIRARLKKLGFVPVWSVKDVRRWWKKTGSTDTKHVEVWATLGRRVDFFFAFGEKTR